MNILLGALAKRVVVVAFTVAIVLNAVEASTGGISNLWWDGLRVGVGAAFVVGLLTWSVTWLVERRQDSSR